MKEKDFNTIKKCKSILSSINNNDFNCLSCNSTDCYKEKDFIKICKKCKRRTFVTQNTVFQNVRFGLVKAFQIVIDCNNSDYNLKSIDVSKKYKISQKTAYLFLSKIRNNKEFVKSLYDFKKPNESKLILIDKLELYLAKKII